MGDRENIKDVGMVVAFVTFFWGVWLVLSDLFYISDGYFGLSLRIIGIFVLTFVAYMPYMFLYRMISKISHQSFLLGFVSVFFVVDVFVRLFVFFGPLSVSGTFFVVIYPAIMTGMIGCVVWGIEAVERFVFEEKVAHRLWEAAKEHAAVLFRRRIL